MYININKKENNISYTLYQPPYLYHVSVLRYLPLYSEQKNGSKITRKKIRNNSNPHNLETRR